MQKRNKMWTIDKQHLQDIIDNSSSMREVCEKLNINSYNGSVRTLYRRMAIDGICTKKLIQNRTSIKRTIVGNLEFCENSKTSRNAIKRFIINNKLIDYKCHACGITDEWNGKTLVLQLEHLNGINDDNRIENLAFICPNCHSQTETFAGRNSKKRIFLDDKKIKEKESYEDKIYRIKSKRKFDPTAEELKDLLQQKIPFTKLGKMFGVSDNAVRKRCRYYKLIE